MKSFLQQVAQDLISKYGTNLSHIAVVFPNKRASLFLSDHLARLAGRPIWSPAYITISDLFRQNSSSTVADPIKLVCDLHKCFVSQTGTDETLDHFYGWGQMLLADFDDLDKNMADADRVLANLSHLHELDDVSYLSEAQKEVIRRFFSNFSEHHDSELKQRFLRLWSKMAPLYHDFNRMLQQQNLAYEGALYRNVVTQLEQNELAGQPQPSTLLQYDCYVFVGFNMVQKAEQRLFALLQRMGRALFYWDYDHYYMSASHEAGHFISQYLEHFPNELSPSLDHVFNCFRQPKEITFISAPTENIQARYVATWLREHNRLAHGRRTAIVLCDEGLLQTVIHSLPEQVDTVNVTTGYPLIQTPAATLVTQLLALQTTGYVPSRNCFRLRQVNSLLRHPYMMYLSDQAESLRQRLNDEKIYYPDNSQLHADEGTTLLFTPAANNAEMLEWMCRIVQLIAQGKDNESPLFQESMFRTYTLLNRLLGLCQSGDLAVDVITLQRLIHQLTSTVSVPFHGEPAEGLQIMGVLETRNLDFDHVLLLSCNEGNLPRGLADTSFIPYSLRKAHELTISDHKVAIYAYYFFRLISRASDVTILYNNSTADGKTGQMSRFMLQLMAEGPHPIRFQSLQAGQRISSFEPKAIEKTAGMMQLLNMPILTPTAINRYLRCPLQFYYNYACNLRQPDNIDDTDTVDNRVFGNIFHEAAHTIYKKLTQQSNLIVASDIESMLKSKVDIERAVDEAFCTQLFQLSRNAQKSMPALSGLQIINREVIIHYVRQLLQADSQLAPFTIVGLECDVKGQIATPHITTNIGGRIDRLDCVTEADGQRLRVIDYKTGNFQPRPLASLDAIFLQDSLAQHSDYYLQAMLYSCLVRRSTEYNPQNMAVSPALLFIQHAAQENFDPVLYFGKERIADVEPHMASFENLLANVIDEIYNPDLPFAPTADRDRCRTCIYRQLCSLGS